MNRWWQRLIFSWLELFRAIIGVLTLGNYWPIWDITFLVWCLRRKVERDKRAKA